MAKASRDRRSGRDSDAPREGTPEYDWLYGSSRGGSPDDEATQVFASSSRDQPDHTQVMPAAPPPGARDPRRAPAQRAPHQQPPPPSQPPRGRRGRGGDGRGRRRWRPRFGIVKLVLLLWLVFLIAVPLIAWSRIDKVDAWPDGERPDEQDGRTYLVVGSDSRRGLTDEQEKQLNAGPDVGQRTDTIMLLHTGSGPSMLMSIPRDSQVEIPGHGTTKINAAFAYGGAKLLVETIEQNTGIRIDDYIEIGMGGFLNMVDAVGGVEICPTEDMKDPQANGLDIKAGCQEADGVTALGYARSRKTSGLGDIARAEHQREVVGQVGKKAVNPLTVLLPWRYWSVAMAGAKSIAISEGTGPVALGRFAWAMTRIQDDGLTCGVPISDLSVQWDEARSKEVFKYIAADETDKIDGHLCTRSGLPE